MINKEMMKRLTAKRKMFCDQRKTVIDYDNKTIKMYGKAKDFEKAVSR